jgi:hypothetical protein
MHRILLLSGILLFCLHTYAQTDSLVRVQHRGFLSTSGRYFYQQKPITFQKAFSIAHRQCAVPNPYKAKAKWNFWAAVGTVVVWGVVAQQLRDKHYRTAGDIVNYSTILPFGWLMTRSSRYKRKAISFYNAHLQPNQ